jgi:hypothetical protein
MGLISHDLLLSDKKTQTSAPKPEENGKKPGKTGKQKCTFFGTYGQDEA